MPFSLFVAFRYLLDTKGQTTLILAAVTVGVGVVVFLSALIGGLQASLIDKTLGSQPHVTLYMPRETPRPLVDSRPGQAIARVTLPASQRLRSIDQWPALLDRLERTEGITAVSPLVTGAGFAVRAEAKESVVIQGVVPERYLAIIAAVGKRIIAGRFEVAGGQVVIGSTLARNLNVGVGDRLTLQTSEGLQDRVTIGGIFSLGNETVDRTWLLTSLRHAQALYALPGGATRIELKVADVFQAEAMALQLKENTGLEADSWMGLNSELLAGLSAQSSSKLMIQFFIVVAVALGIASVLAVSVVQKEREIGILRAMGIPAWRVLAVFLVQGGVLGLAGAVSGSGFGLLLSGMLEAVSRAPDGTSRFPVTLDPGLIIGALVLSTLVGLLAAVMPARRAAGIDPATAIRNG